MNSLSSLNLHDSIITEIVIDRSNTKIEDKISFGLQYVENYNPLAMRPKELIFSGCLKAIFDMNFGITTSESILTADEVTDSHLIQEIKLKFKKSGIDISSELKHFRIETNSTASIIEIVAESVYLLESSK